MARALRVEYPGACYHLINRGNYRRNLFAEHGAAEAFVRTLGETAERFGWKIHAYVVMRNHFHLALEITEPNLSSGMKWLQGTWVRRYNGYRQLVGRPFQGRYKGILVEPGHSLAQVCHYIHLNPVRTGVVTLETIFEYRHSSMVLFRERDRPNWLDPQTVLTAAGNLPDKHSSWATYVAYLEVLITDNISRSELTSEKITRGWCYGSADFRKAARADLARAGSTFEKTRFNGIEAETVQQEREAAWSERLARFAKRTDVDLANLSAKKSHPDKLLLAAALKRSTSVSNSWLAARLELGAPRALSTSIARWHQAGTNAQRVENLLRSET